MKKVAFNQGMSQELFIDIHPKNLDFKDYFECLRKSFVLKCMPEAVTSM
jgi:hypothetical protein